MPVALTLHLPLADTYVIQPFGVNWTGIVDFYSRFNLPAHEGIDFHAPEGTVVVAAADGVITRIEPVEFSGRMGWPYGVQVRIAHLGSDQQIYTSIYAHLRQVSPSLIVGMKVSANAPLGTSDHTGNAHGDHLHFALKRAGASAEGFRQTLPDGRTVVYPSDLIDPTPYFVPALTIPAAPAAGGS